MAKHGSHMRQPSGAAGPVVGAEEDISADTSGTYGTFSTFPEAAERTTASVTAAP